MERILNKLKKKYGTPKLLKFLRDLNPHLSPPQKKLNKEYMRYTRFGSGAARAPTPPPRTRPSGPSTPLRPRSSVARPSTPPPRTHPSSGPSTPLRPPSTSTSAQSMTPGTPRTGETTHVRGVSVTILYKIETQYRACISELATITSKDLLPRPDSVATDIPAALSGIFKKYQGALHLVHNTEGLYEKIKEREKGKFGAVVRTKRETNASSFGSGTDTDTDTGTKRPRARTQKKPYDNSPPAHAIINLKTVKGFMKGSRPTVQDQERVDNKYGFSDSSSAGTVRRGWNNTLAQNDHHFGPTVNPTRFQKEQCRCSLCGSYMYVVDSGPGNPGCNTATVQLEHHIPASRAAEIYADVWQVFDGQAPNMDNLQQYEQAFFISIGGANAVVQNMFTYTCALCNQVKSNLKPYMIVGNNLVVNQECLQAFDNRLCEIFIEFVSNPSEAILNWIRTNPDPPIDNCAITQHRTCMHIWVCQIITTFIVRQNIPYGTFVSAHIYQHIQAYKTRKEEDKRTDLQMWHYYVRPAMQQVLSQKLRDIPPPSLPPPVPPPLTHTVKEQYFGRPVNDDGVTIPRTVDAPDYQSIIEKFQGILNYMENRVHDLYN